MLGSKRTHSSTPRKTMYLHMRIPVFALMMTAFIMIVSTLDAATYVTTVTNITPDLNNREASTAGKKVDRAFVYGFELSLRDEHLETTPSFDTAQRVELSSLSIMNRSKRHPRIDRFVDPLKVAVYTTDHRLVGVSQDTMPANVLGQISTVHFSNTILETHSKYRFVFVDQKEADEGLHSAPETLPKAIRYGMEFYAVQGALSLFSAQEGRHNLRRDLPLLQLDFAGFMPVITIQTVLPRQESPELGTSQPSSPEQPAVQPHPSSASVRPHHLTTLSSPSSSVKSAGKSPTNPTSKAKVNWVTDAESSHPDTTAMLVLVISGLALLVIAFLTLWHLRRK